MRQWLFWVSQTKLSWEIFWRPHRCRFPAVFWVGTEFLWGEGVGEVRRRKGLVGGKTNQERRDNLISFCDPTRLAKKVFFWKWSLLCVGNEWAGNEESLQKRQSVEQVRRRWLRRMATAVLRIFLVSLHLHDFAVFGSGDCEPIGIPMCQNIGYNFTRLPNQFNHETQEEVTDWYLLIVRFVEPLTTGCATFFLKMPDDHSVAIFSHRIC